VSSPIGELPFEATSIALRRSGIEVEGAMGAWPAHVHLDYADVPRLARVLPRPLLGALAASAVVLTVGRRRRRRRPPRP
jgi:hypothetical protein